MARNTIVNILILLAFCAPAQAQFAPEKTNPLETTLIDSSVQIIDPPDALTPLKDGTLGLWHGKPFLISENKLQAIDTKELKSSLHNIPDITQVTRLQLSQDGRLIGITSDGKDDFAFVESAELHALEKIKLPIHISGPSATNVVMAARGADLLILVKKTLFCWDGTKWSTKTIPHIEGSFYFPHEMLLSRDKLYMRYDFGQNGGGLACFDMTSQECKKIFDKTAVTDMLLDSKDRVWFTHQDAEGGILHGALSLYENDKLSTPLSDKTNASPYMSIGLNQDGSILIGTLDKGIVKFTEGQKAESLTPEWNANAYIMSVLPLESNGFCFFASGHGVFVTNNLVDDKFKQPNSASLFRLNLKKYFFQTAGNKQYFEDNAKILEQAGKYAQAAAFYLLSSLDFAAEQNEKGAELAMACAERVAVKAPDQLVLPLVQELYSIANSELVKSIKLKKFALRSILNIYKEQKLTPDSSFEAATALLSQFPEDIQLVRNRKAAKTQAEVEAEADAPFSREPAFGRDPKPDEDGSEPVNEMRLQNNQVNEH